MLTKQVGCNMNKQIKTAVDLVHDRLVDTNSNMTYSQFCEATGFQPGEYAMNKWTIMMNLISQWGEFDTGTLARVLSYGVADIPGQFEIVDRGGSEPVRDARVLLAGRTIMLETVDGDHEVYFTIKDSDPVGSWEEIDKVIESHNYNVVNKDSFLWWSNRPKYLANLGTEL